MSEVINLNDLVPPPPAGSSNVKWQKGAATGIDPSTGLPVYPVSAYLPNAGGANFTAEIPAGAVDGVNATFTLSNSPTFVLFLAVNGVIQNPLLPVPDYTIAANVITMTKAPLLLPSPSTLLIVYSHS